MTPIRLLASVFAVIALASCANRSDYDMSDPYGTGDSGSSYAAPSSTPSNPVYDSPAAYEENSGGSSIADSSYTSGDTSFTPQKKTPSTSQPAVSSPARSGGTTHTVVKGDSLWTISRKYNVSISSIKAANNMTSDVVVLGKKLTIPAR
ncbi:MAG: LysM peptidoglycan-binding domain-containing protein [Luteolibacter sp.]